MTGIRILRQFFEWLRRHAAYDRNSVTITVAPAQAERTFQIELPRWSLRVLAVLLLAALLLIVVGGVLYGKLIRDTLALREIRSENEALRAQALRLEQIERQMVVIDELRKQLFGLAGVPLDAEDSLHAASGAESLMVRTAGAGEETGGGVTGAIAGTPLCVPPFRGPLTRGFMDRRRGEVEHPGVDVAGQEGAPVAAAGSGLVSFAGWDATYGNLLVIDHGDGWSTRYGHGQSLLVSAGDRVLAGQTVAFVGSTGESSAPHLHFEVWRDGACVDPGRFFTGYQVAR